MAGGRRVANISVYPSCFSGRVRPLRGLEGTDIRAKVPGLSNPGGLGMGIGWAATTPPALAVGIVVMIVVGLIACYAILRKASREEAKGE